MGYWLIALPVIIALIQGPYLTFSWKKVLSSRKAIGAWIIVVLLITNAVLNFVDQLRKNREEPYNSNAGTINAPNVRIPYPELKIGGTTLASLGGGTNFGALFLNLKLDIWVKDGKLFLNTYVTDENGDKIGEIDSNEWSIAPCKAYDRNFDDHGIEIMDAHGQIVLQLDWDGEGVNFAGVFYRKELTKNPWMAIYPRPDGQGAAIEFRLREDLLHANIQPIFRYPSSLHKGERIKK